MSLLQTMAHEPCESFTGPAFGGTRTCMDPHSGRTPDAAQLAYRYCPPCRLRAALGDVPYEYAIVWADRPMPTDANLATLQSLEAAEEHLKILTAIRQTGAYKDRKQKIIRRRASAWEDLP